MALEIGICSYINPELDPGQTVRLLCQSRFRILTVWGADRDCISPMPKWYKDQLQTARTELGFVLDSLHAPFLLTPELSDADKRVRIKAVDRLKLSLADAGELGIPIVIVHGHRQGEPSELSPEGRRSFEELVEAAAGGNVRLAMENTLESIKPLEWFLSEFPAEHVGFCYDSGHDQLSSGKPFELLRRWGHRLLTTHIQDNRGQNDDHLPPGEGTIDWQEFAKAFPWDSYRGNFVLEANMSSTCIGDPAEFLQTCYASAERILKLAEQIRVE